jgi:hypothetical protein
MAFEPRIIEAKLALNLISSTEMPAVAWDALEAGLDGPAIRRLAALEFPTFFEVSEVLPRAMGEMHLLILDEGKAALRLARVRAQEILKTNADPFKHVGDFYHLWIQSHYCRELQDYGNLDDEVYVAGATGQTEQDVREWLLDRLKKLAATEEHS